MMAVTPGAAELARLAERWAGAGPPIIVFNKSHSGSRVLARLLREAGVFMGADLNESEDAHDMLRLVEPLVENHYPDYPGLFRDGDPALAPLTNSVLTHHLQGRPAGARWGWKLCETGYILPVLHRIFPTAWYVHLLRDGRDVAFSDHVAPELPFWRKVYFDTARLNAWQGRGLLHPDYRKAPHVFNARHWVNSVTVARHYGAMIGERYIELRYEELVTQPAATAAWLLPLLGLPVQPEVVGRFAATVTAGVVGKHRSQPSRKQAEAMAVLSPTLEAFGYGTPAPAPTRQRSLLDRLRRHRAWTR